jgi:hypothetical protein
MVPTFKSKTLITDLYSMNPPDSRVGIAVLHPIHDLCFQLERHVPVDRLFREFVYG